MLSLLFRPLRFRSNFMKTSFGPLAVVLTFTGSLAIAGDPKAEAIADSVIKASGGDNWPKVKRIGFTFNVEQAGKVLLSAKHEWDVTNHKDKVTWDGKTVTVDIKQPATDEDGKAAFQRWTNDSYWLLAPLKLRDPGTNLALVPTEGAEQLDVLQLTFGAVGLTPKDSYNLYIDRATHLLKRWDYMPAADTKMTGTWDAYQKCGGLTLSTEHQMGDKRIFFTDIKVETK
jgi:hypothetical protein